MKCILLFNITEYYGLQGSDSLHKGGVYLNELFTYDYSKQWLLYMDCSYRNRLHGEHTYIAYICLCCNRVRGKIKKNCTEANIKSEIPLFD